MIGKFLNVNVRWIVGVLAVGIIVAVLFSLGRCSGDNDDAQQQAQQTTRSTTAISSAASEAIGRLEGRTADEKSIDEAVATATQEIHDATTVQAIHASVVAQVCSNPAYASDPACVRK